MKRILIIAISGFLAFGCTGINTNNQAKLEQLKVENDSLRNVMNKNQTNMKKQIITALTFQDNNAENAMNFYLEVFDNSKIIDVQYWGKDAPVEEGKVMKAIFELDGNLFMCSDSPPIHDWDFTPAVSNYIECDSNDELERLFSKLSENGTVAMPLNNYGFSKKYGWVMDKYGISWQLNLE